MDNTEPLRNPHSRTLPLCGAIEEVDGKANKATTYSVVAKTLRKIAGSFPRVDLNGVVYEIKAGKVGSASRAGRTILSEDEINGKYPAQPLVILPNANIRASRCKEGKADWTEHTMKEAVDELLVPDGFQYIIVSPEVFDRSELAKQKEFVKTDVYGSVTGVMAPCIYCNSNEYVCHSEFNIQKRSNRRPRVTFGADGTMKAMVSPIFKCTNPVCVGKEPEPGKGQQWHRDWEKTKTHTFSIWTKEAFSQYPDKVRERYSRFFSGIGINSDGTTYADDHLCLDILDDRTNLEFLAERLSQYHQLYRERTQRNYESFVLEQSAGRKFNDNQTIEITWPDFDANQFDSDFHPPKVDAIKNLFSVASKLANPLLLRVLKDHAPDHTQPAPIEAVKSLPAKRPGPEGRPTTGPAQRRSRKEPTKLKPLQPAHLEAFQLLPAKRPGLADRRKSGLVRGWPRKEPTKLTPLVKLLPRPAPLEAVQFLPGNPPGLEDGRKSGPILVHPRIEAAKLNPLVQLLPKPAPLEAIPFLPEKPPKLEDVRPARKLGRPRKEPTQLKPLEQLSLAEAKRLTTRELHVYTKYLADKKPNQKKDALAIVQKYLQMLGQK